MKAEKIERRFSAGECILELGSKARELYVIRAGNVRLRENGNGADHLLGPGALFGEITAITGTPAAYRAEADDDTTLLVIDLPLLNRLCLESPEFAFRLIRHLAGRAGEAPRRPAVARVEAVRAQPGKALEALGAVILERSSDGGTPCVVKGNLRDLAEDADLSLRSAYIALHSLLDKRWLRLVDDQLTLLKREELEALVKE